MTAMDWIELDDDGKPLSRPSSVSSFQSSHSRLSFLTTSSSLSSSSTFSDISINSLASVPSPPPTASKTHAFFSSPFPTRPPSPAPSIVSLSSQAQRHQQHQPSPPAPPALAISTQWSPDSTSSRPKSKTNDFFAIPSIDISAPNAQQDEQTPRPPNLEPSLSQLWARQSNSLQPPSLHTTLTPSLSKSSPPSSPSHSPPASLPSTLPPCDSPRPGYVISSNLPASPLTSATSLLSPDARNAMPPATPMDATSLRLVRLLGHGAFSSVWLADDLSSVPLVLRTRKSLRDLKRQASSENSISSSSLVALLNPSASLDMTLSRSGSLKRLRERVGGTKPIGSLVDGSEERFFVGDESESPLPGSPSAASAALHRRHTTASSPSHRGAKVDDAVLVSQIGRRGGSLRLLEQDRRRLRRDRAFGLGINPDLDPHDAPDADYEMGDGYWRSVHAHLQRRKEEQRLVAVKMTVRSGATGWWGDSNTLTVREREEREKEKERTRVAFVREVEVLRHISHPNITPLLTHLSTPTHHVLVLPYLPGGDLLSLVNSDNAWSKLRESVLRRMWNEVCKAVGWMHSVGIVHRDLKLENILLTTCIFADLAAADALSTNARPDNPSENATSTLDDPTLTAPTLHDFPPPPLPLIKLTDFGLSRFVDIRSDEERDRDRTRRREAKRAIMNGAAHNYVRSDVGQYSDEGDNVDIEELEDEDEDEGPLLHTRCGSEAYAAPELVMGGGSSASSPMSQRKKLKPAGIYDGRETDSWACGVVLYALIARRLPFGEGVVAANESSGVGHVGHGGIGASGGRTQGGRLERRQWLMRIARGEYEWPGVGDGDDVDGHEAGAGEEELIGERLALSQGAKKVVERLLVRDPKKRARVADLLTDEWVCGWDGSVHSTPRSSNGGTGIEPSPSVVSSASSFSSFGSCLTIRDLGLDAAADGYGLAGHQEQLVVDAPNGYGGMNDADVEEDIGLDDVADIVEDLGEGWLVDEHGIDKVARREVIA